VTTQREQATRGLLRELHFALAGQVREAEGSRGSLRDAVCAYVEIEHARGSSLAKIIQTVKDILRKAEEAASTATSATERRDDNLAQQLVDWCVEFHRSARARAV
jgi:hypothetical protein